MVRERYQEIGGMKSRKMNVDTNGKDVQNMVYLALRS